MALSKRANYGRRARSLSILAAGLVGLLASGCSTGRSKQQILERVAKDWSQTIRASQVLPIYPLSEDLRPGDIFWDTTPIDELPKLWRRRGYLKLPLLVKRLNPNCYQNFYRQAYGLEGNPPVPDAWQFPPDGSAALPGTSSQPSSAQATGTAWGYAPRASFPSYAFEVQQGKGFDLALPVKAVSLGLSFLKNGSASGTIAIKDAYTYGLDLDTLWNDVSDWLGSQGLSAQRSTDEVGDPVGFFRVASRVYMAHAVSVTLQSKEASAGGLAAGFVGKSLDPSKYVDMLSQVNSSLTTSLARTSESTRGGLRGSVQFTSLSSSTVSLDERFPRPLAIGFLALDVPVYQTRSEPSIEVYGPPIPTMANLEQGRAPRNARGSSRAARLALPGKALAMPAFARSLQTLNFWAELDRWKGKQGEAGVVAKVVRVLDARTAGKFSQIVGKTPTTLGDLKTATASFQNGDASADKDEQDRRKALVDAAVSQVARGQCGERR